MASAEVQSDTGSRYVVGIDLGTTNSAVNYVDTQERPWRVRTFSIPQWTAPGQIESREVLPSFHYQPAPGELPADALRLPWDRQPRGYAVGFFARDQGSLVPGRMVASAKSWLSHTGVDRTADLLPWDGAADVERLSPVTVSARILLHVREAWDHLHAGFPLAEQDVVLTLPASFDEVARELTVRAAQQAGLPRVVLIEEPQAAFYAWIDAHPDTWQEHVSPGQKILVVDIGGGTTDFTLIRVREGETGRVQFHRMAVGNHLILGGDNLDLALGHHLERRLTSGGQLDARAWSVLVRNCRIVKESLLGPAAPERFTVSVPGGGSRLIGGALQVEVSRDEVSEVLLDGFFPRVALDERPVGRQSGFQEFGLPYAPDPAATRYLAAFLTAHRHVTVGDEPLATDHDPARPDILLFNGGVFESHAIRDRIVETITGWFEGDAAWKPAVLDNVRLDLAVARGAAYYGMVRRGEGVRIAAGLARTYYIGVQADEPTAVCLVPAGIEPGQDAAPIGRRFDLLVSEPVEFPLLVSSTRLTDRPGTLVPVDREQMTSLPPIRTVLKTRKKGESGRVAVQLHARLTEIGTLDLWCSELDGRRSWRLVFDVRSATQTDREAHESDAESQGFLDEETWQSAEALIRCTFGPSDDVKPESLVKRLAEVLGSGRNQWPSSLLRRIWEMLMEHEEGRRRSPVYESRWLNLLGFALRPGYGLAVDDWRVAETWRVLQGRLVHPTAMCRNEWFILWRRIAGGLAPGQQQALADPLLASVRGLVRQTVGGKSGSGDVGLKVHETPEIWRLLGSLELLPVATKTELGQMILDLVGRRKMAMVRPALLWAIGRLGARQPLYGPLNAVVPPEVASAWLERLLDEPDHEILPLALMELARRTGDRYRDLSDRRRDQAIARLERLGAPSHFAQLVREGGSLDDQEQGLLFGESLPQGLRLGA